MSVAKSQNNDAGGKKSSHIKDTYRVTPFTGKKGKAKARVCC